MKLTKKQAKNFLDGWDYIKEYNRKGGKQVSQEEYIKAFDETIKEGKTFCAKCNLCDKCD